MHLNISGIIIMKYMYFTMAYNRVKIIKEDVIYLHATEISIR